MNSAGSGNILLNADVPHDLFSLFHLSSSYPVVVAGKHNRYSYDVTERIYQVDDVYKHPRHRESPYDYDIALLHVNEDIVFNENVQPACPPDDVTSDYAYRKVQVSGWGHTSYGTISIDTFKIVCQGKSNTYIRRKYFLGKF